MHGHGGHGDAGTAAATDSGQDSPPFLTRDKLVLILGLITYGIGQTVLFVVFPPVVEEIGLSLTQFGLIFSISNLVLGLAAIYWGRLSDKVGRKPLLMLGLFGYALGSLIVALALEWGLRGSPSPNVLFAVILGARLLYGGFASAIQPSATAYIADTTDRSQRTRGMALMGLTAGLGTILGPVLGGGLAFVSVVFPMYVAIGLSLLAIALIGVMLKEPERHAAAMRPGKVSAWDPRVRSYLILFFCYFLLFTMVQVITAFYLERQIGVVGRTNVAQATASALVAMAICTVFMQAYVLQRFRFRIRTLLRSACPAFAIGMAILLFADGMPSVIVAYIFFGLGLSCAGPGVNGGASLSVEPHEQGAIGGLLAAAPILGMVIGPFAGPVLFERVSPTAPILTGVIAMTALSIYAFTIKVAD